MAYFNNESYFEVSGYLQYDEEHCEYFTLVDEGKEVNITEIFKSINLLYNNPDISISYYVCDKKESHENIKTNYTHLILGGEVTAEMSSSSYYYSEYTHGTDYNNTLDVGGHNLISDLCDIYNRNYEKDNYKYILLCVVINK